MQARNFPRENFQTKTLIVGLRVKLPVLLNYVLCGCIFYILVTDYVFSGTGGSGVSAG